MKLDEIETLAIKWYEEDYKPLKWSQASEFRKNQYSQMAAERILTERLKESSDVI